ncbi:MAG: LysM peptidoglycan-binding domain-containing protein [Chloroflexi bacterium]|nr:LysM peptidoglycan-binding domain-containing protein [Chloroflexota bacterium]
MRKYAKAIILALVLIFLYSSPIGAVSSTIRCADGTGMHVVAVGDTLSAIARCYGTTVTALVQANHIANPNLIFPGQRLIIPPPNADPATSQFYVVRPGDTLAGIARKYGTSVEALTQLNSLSNPSLIYVGQSLILSTSSSPPPAPTGEPVVHIVQRGETLYLIAQKYSSSVSALASVNDIANPSLIYVGQRLLIPGGGAATFASPIVAVEIVPTNVYQGQTLFLRVKTEGDAMLTGNLEGRPLTFFGSNGEYWSVVGFAPWDTPGPYLWSIKATDGQGRTGNGQGTVLVVDYDFPIDYIDLPPDREGLLDPAVTVPERDRLAVIFAQITSQPLWQGIFQLPLVGEKSSFFGEGRSYDGGPVASYHLGVDYNADEGDTVLAANSGRVVLAETLQVRGNTVIIDHGLGVYTGYFHLSQILVAVGQEVKKGQLIGYVGGTGLATGPHLHWEMRIAGVPVDPEEWTIRTFPP